MKISKKLVVVFASVLALSAIAGAQSFTLKRVAKVGETMKYKLTAEADFGGQAIQVSGTTLDKVVKVNDNGDIVVESTQSSMKVSVAGQEMEIPDQPGTTTTYKATGEVVEIKGEQTDASAYRMANLNVVKSPTGEIKVGDKWTYEVKADSKTGAAAGKAEYELLGSEKVGSWDSLKIKWTFKETEGSDPASSSGTVWIDAATGALVKAVGEYKNAPIPGAPGPISMKFTLERVS